MMILRILAVGTFAVLVNASPVSAQGRSPQQVVLSPSVSKSLTANRQKSKSPLTARAGVRRTRASTGVTSVSAPSAPTSVRAIKKAPIIK